ncbi:kinase-like protein [Dothidotthia symphoricarpi CBS 119687]|uniref:Kinase-like protein n=1 Tax=Dothidotthia symphoricarpi CBS 119687 TaxID=1392245 RepID=A0A6A6A2I0_9PLEO|nr:kinase-like protein [Dothidotthia symphoricarpi CBS 119687]KAF2126202.1 kinase-like protein [Dothidotthia symphoricarpi CBS 119687]
MALRIGQVLRGAKHRYELLYPLKDSTVFKAKVLSSRIAKAEWVMIKTAATDEEKMCLRREYRNYRVEDIASSPYIRALCDIVRLNEHQDDPSCLVFGWMDHDLGAVTAPEFRGNPVIPRVVSKAVLSALDVLRTINGVHTDVSPNNIFVSHIHGSSPVAKLGDLGNAIKDGSSTQRLQSLPCRAPEVWQGLACRHSSDVWSLGATLTTKASPLGLFGDANKVIDGHTEAYPLGQPIDCQTYKNEFKLAEQLAVMDHPLSPIKLITKGNWREELQHIPDPSVSPDLLDFIESLLVIDPDKRPLASEALLHPYLQYVA